MLRIAVYAIAKDEEEFVARFCDSAKDADIILIADTGSGDATVANAIASGAVVHRLEVSPWRFDHARNASLALLPKDIDVCVCADIDEVFMPGWREEIERLWVKGTTRMRYVFDWGKGVVFKAEKIHSRHGYHWHHPCHESLRADPRITESWVESEMLMVKHLPDETKSRGQYLSMLKVGIMEDPHCSRNAIYYARELTFSNLWDEAVIELQRYLQLPSAIWNAERAFAMRLLGDGMESLGRHQEALYWYRQSTFEAPGLREPHFHLAKALHRRSAWREALRVAEKALAVTHRELSYLSEPEAWGAGPWDIAAIASYNIARYTDAQTYGRTALSFAPNDIRLSSNCEFYDRMVASPSADGAILPLSS